MRHSNNFNLQNIGLIRAFIPQVLGPIQGYRDEIIRNTSSFQDIQRRSDAKWRLTEALQNTYSNIKKVTLKIYNDEAKLNIFCDLKKYQTILIELKE